MTRNVRESRNYMLAGFVYLDGNQVHGLKSMVELGREFTLELRFPNGVTKSQEMMVVPLDRTTLLEQRSSVPRKLYYKG